jgi:hypothetical protein
MIDKILKRIAEWRGKLISYSARIVLIKTCLASIPVYLMSFLKFPKWAIKLINSHLAHCLWSDSEHNRKFHLINWSTVAMRKEFGGLGIPDLNLLNICLLAFWVKRYNANRGKLCRELVDSKYATDDPNIFLQ